MIARKVHLDMEAVVIAGALTLSGFLAWLDPHVGDSQLLWTLIKLSILDFITGVTKAWVKNQSITSTGYRSSIGKAIQYGSFIIIAQIISSGVLTGGQAVYGSDKIIIVTYMALCFTEIKSIIENATEIRKNSDFVSSMSKKILGVINSIFKK